MLSSAEYYPMSSMHPSLSITHLVAHLHTLMTLLFITPSVQAHGRLREPPSRSSMWRNGYPTPVNYNDNQLFCGGFQVGQDTRYKTLFKLGMVI